MCCYADPESVARGFEAPPTATKYQQFRGCAPVPDATKLASWSFGIFHHDQLT
jgi:hypothetical protein